MLSNHVLPPYALNDALDDLDRRYLIYSVVMDADVVTDFLTSLALSWKSEYSNIVYVCICEMGMLQSCMKCVGLKGPQQWHTFHKATSPVTSSNIHLLKPWKQGVLLGRNSAYFLAQDCVLTGKKSFTTSFPFYLISVLLHIIIIWERGAKSPSVTLFSTYL